MNDMIQTGFDYAALPVESVDRLKTIKRDIAIIDNLACVQIGQKLKEAQVELNMRGKAGSGFVEWVELETPYGRQAAYDMINIAARFGKNDFQFIGNHFSQTVLARLAAPSTPDAVIEKAIEKAETGAKVTVADVKDWKSELEAERQARARVEADVAQLNQRNADWREQSLNQRNKIRELESQIDLLGKQPKPEPEKVVVKPDDYETAKTKAAQLETELANLKKEQAKLINSQVKAKLHEYQSEVDEMERRKTILQEQVDRMKDYMASKDKEDRRLAVHQQVIEELRLKLLSLAVFLSDEDPVKDADTLKLWRALADMLAEAMNAVRHYAGDPKPALSVIRGEAA